MFKLRAHTSRADLFPVTVLASVRTSYGCLEANHTLIDDIFWLVRLPVSSPL